MNKIQNITINPEQLIGYKDYENAWEIDLLVEDRIVIAYKDLVLEAHLTDDSCCVDYTVYKNNSDCLSEIDGGQIIYDDNVDSIQLIDLMNDTGIKGLTSQKFEDVNWQNIQLISTDDFMDII